MAIFPFNRSSTVPLVLQDLQVHLVLKVYLDEMEEMDGIFQH